MCFEGVGERVTKSSVKVAMKLGVKVVVGKGEVKEEKWEVKLGCLEKLMKEGEGLMGLEVVMGVEWKGDGEESLRKEKLVKGAKEVVKVGVKVVKEGVILKEDEIAKNWTKSPESAPVSKSKSKSKEKVK